METHFPGASRAARESLRSKQPDWARLPAELLMKVLVQLEDQHARRHGDVVLPLPLMHSLGHPDDGPLYRSAGSATAMVSLVCSEWKAVHDALVVRLVVPAKIDHELFRKLVGRFPRVVALHCKGRDSSIDRLLAPPHVEPPHVSDLLKDESMQMVASALPNLTHLHLSACNLSDEAVKAASSLPALRTLIISEDPPSSTTCRMTDEAVKAVSSMPKLTFLEFGHCKHITDAAVQTMSASKMPLTSLNLSCCDITDAAVQAMSASKMPLTSLDLSCLNITDAAVRAIGESRMPLTYLNLSSCWNLTDEAVQAISASHMPLRCLNLSDCGSITDAAVQAIGESRMPLTSLDLSHVSGLTRVAMQALSNLPLKVLNLEFCDFDALGHLGISELGRIPTLTSLDLTCCGATDHDLVHLSDLTNLKYLKLEECLTSIPAEKLLLKVIPGLYCREGGRNFPRH
jgi:Leucine-rich repeat (LRR) protein